MINTAMPDEQKLREKVALRICEAHYAIPAGEWDGERDSDWRDFLDEADAAIALCRHEYKNKIEMLLERADAGTASEAYCRGLEAAIRVIRNEDEEDDDGG